MVLLIRSKGLEATGGLLDSQGNDVVIMAQKAREEPSGVERVLSGGER